MGAMLILSENLNIV